MTTERLTLMPCVEDELYNEIARVQKLLVQCYNRTADFNGEVLGIKADNSGVVPLTPERFVFRVKACLEELEEAVAAYQRGDHGEVIDAFLDMDVFGFGGVLEMNVPAGHCFEDIIRANLEKKKGKLDKRPESGGNDAVKPEGWKPPNHDWVFHLSPVAIHVAKLHATKVSDYGHWSRYFPFGHTSFLQMLHMKVERLKNLNPDFFTGEINHESVLDSVLDLVNYGNFYAEWLMNPEAFPSIGAR